MLTLLSVLPSIVLFIFVWKKDKIEKEPPKLLLKLFLFGALTTVSAMILGEIFTVITLEFIYEDTLTFAIIDNFILTALIEEGGKYFVLKKCTWKHKAFNYTFDGVIYAVCASLGFATLENILYVVGDGLSTAILRALLAVPGHVIDALYMGCYYGIAKYEEALGNTKQSKSNLKKALLVPVLIHGFYDFCLSDESGLFLIVFLVFEIIITIKAVKKLKSLSKEDKMIFSAADQTETTHTDQ
ncbi:MAG: PrsW family intramembrane metalloprotease [Lachnospiraceae bacterium]|nr:PrsW family intramembrane metalloprotease [Lachnospiraceae bacterium]